MLRHREAEIVLALILRSEDERIVEESQIILQVVEDVGGARVQSYRLLDVEVSVDVLNEKFDLVDPRRLSHCC